MRFNGLSRNLVLLHWKFQEATGLSSHISFLRFEFIKPHGNRHLVWRYLCSPFRLDRRESQLHLYWGFRNGCQQNPFFLAWISMMNSSGLSKSSNWCYWIVRLFSEELTSLRVIFIFLSCSYFLDLDAIIFNLLWLNFHNASEPLNV